MEEWAINGKGVIVLKKIRYPSRKITLRNQAPVGDCLAAWPTLPPGCPASGQLGWAVMSFWLLLKLWPLPVAMPKPCNLIWPGFPGPDPLLTHSPGFLPRFPSSAAHTQAVVSSCLFLSSGSPDSDPSCLSPLSVCLLLVPALQCIDLLAMAPAFWISSACICFLRAHGICTSVLSKS